MIQENASCLESIWARYLQEHFQIAAQAKKTFNKLRFSNLVDLNRWNLKSSISHKEMIEENESCQKSIWAMTSPRTSSDSCPSQEDINKFKDFQFFPIWMVGARNHHFCKGNWYRKMHLVKIRFGPKTLSQKRVQAQEWPIFKISDFCRFEASEAIF